MPTTPFNDIILAVTAAEQATDAQLAAKDATNTLTAQQRDDALAEVRRLQKIVDGIPPVDPPPVDPPPAKRVMPIGGVEADDLEKLIGERLGMYRRYDSDSVDLAKLKSFIAKDSGGSGPRMRAYSAKGLASALSDSMLDAIPADGQITVMIFQNEPERPDKATNRTQYLTDLVLWINHVRSWATARKRTDVWPGMANMGYQEIDNKPETSTPLWWPTGVDFGGPVPVVLELHPYDKGANTLRSLYKPTLDLWHARGGTTWGLGEIGSLGRTDTAEAAWINQGISDAYDDGAQYVAFFDSAIGGAGDWSNTTPAVIAAIAKNAPAYSR